jgi:uncharacterized protein
MDPVTALQLADWRRATAALYARVREQADPAAAHALWRAGRDGLMSSHPQSALPEGDPLRITGVPYWPYDPALRFAVPVEPAAEPRRYEIDTGADGVTRLEQAGWVTIPAPVGRRLALWWLDQYGGGLFLPARDATAGGASYGGGRYLLDTAKGADLGSDGRLIVIDFNFLYHPSCRYNPRWVCPLAPAENTIDVPVNAGERLTPVQLLLRFPAVDRPALGGRTPRRAEKKMGIVVHGQGHEQVHGTVTELLNQRRELGFRVGEDERVMPGVLDRQNGGDDLGGRDVIPLIGNDAFRNRGVHGRHRHVAHAADGLAEPAHHVVVDDEHGRSRGDAPAELVHPRDLADEGALEGKPVEVHDRRRHDDGTRAADDDKGPG